MAEVPSAGSTEERLRALEAENERLRERVAAESPRGGKGRRWLRGTAATAMIVVAALLVPVGVLVTWAGNQLLDENRFISTFAPLSEHPAIQEEITVKVTSLIDERLDIDALTNSVIDGVIDLGLPERAQGALDLLRGPAADGIRGIIESGVSQFVASDVFSATWEQALRVSHRAFVAAVTSNASDGQALTIDSSGQIAIQLGPVIDSVKQALLDRGFGFAANIPAIQAEIPLATSDALPTLKLIVTLTTIVSWWLPIVIVALLGAGIALSPRRSTAVAGAGVGLALGAALTLGVFQAAAAVLQLQAPGIGVAAEALAAVFAQLVDGMRAVAAAILFLGVVVFLIGLSQGTSRSAVALRRGVTSGTNQVRGALVTRGWHPTGIGGWLARQRLLTRTVLVVLAVLGLLLLPFSVASIITIAIVLIVLWWILTLLELPTEATAEPATIAGDEVSPSTP